LTLESLFPRCSDDFKEKKLPGKMFASVQNHKILNLIGIVSIAVAFVTSVIFNALAGSGSSDIFVSTVGNLSDKYDLSFTPAGFTFSIWSIIYIWLAAAIGFFIYTLFSSSDEGKLYLNPEVVTPWFSFFFTTNLLYNLAWIFVWDREQIVGASIMLFLVAKTNIISLAILARNIAKDGHQLREDKPKIYWLYVVLPMNGQGIYTTWTIIASLLNFGHALRYEAKYEMEYVSHVCLGLLIAVIIIYFILENLVLDNYIRLLLTPYLVVIWASIGIVAEKGSDATVPDSTKNLVYAILGLTCVLLVLRIVIVVIRQLKRPLGRSGISQISDKPAY